MNPEVVNELLFLIKLSVAIMVANFVYCVLRDLWGPTK